MRAASNEALYTTMVLPVSSSEISGHTSAKVGLRNLVVLNAMDRSRTLHDGLG